MEKGVEMYAGATGVCHNPMYTPRAYSSSTFFTMKYFLVPGLFYSETYFPSLLR